MPLPPLDPSIIAAGITSGGQVFSDILNFIESRSARRYNHPKRQLQRYREAGLSPSLLLSQGVSPGQHVPAAFNNIGAAAVSGYAQGEAIRSAKRENDFMEELASIEYYDPETRKTEIVGLGMSNYEALKKGEVARQHWAQSQTAIKYDNSDHLLEGVMLHAMQEVATLSAEFKRDMYGTEESLQYSEYQVRQKDQQARYQEAITRVWTAKRQEDLQRVFDTLRAKGPIDVEFYKALAEGAFLILLTTATGLSK